MNWLSRRLIDVGRLIDRGLTKLSSPRLRPEFAHLQFSANCLQKLIDDYPFESVLDIGSGAGAHSELFLRHGKRVTAIDYGDSIYFRQCQGRISTIVADFNDYPFEDRFDCVWCSHVLEHQLDAQRFLRKVHEVLEEGGTLAVTVPPLKEEIVGGHVSLWNGGLLLYRLVLAGFDCRDASLLQDGYNVSVLVRKRTIDVLDTIEYDAGDIRKLRPFLPPDLPYRESATDDPFHGGVNRLNW